MLAADKVCRWVRIDTKRCADLSRFQISAVVAYNAKFVRVSMSREGLEESGRHAITCSFWRPVLVSSSCRSHLLVVVCFIMLDTRRLYSSYYLFFSFFIGLLGFLWSRRRERKKVGLADLPGEILSEVFLYLDWESLCSVKQVSLCP